MTPKQKAKELVKKFRMYSFTTDYDYAENGAENEYYNAEKCALIAVNEIIDEYWLHDTERKEYWQQVKTEIKKL
jgi:hypothetical protein